VTDSTSETNRAAQKRQDCTSCRKSAGRRIKPVLLEVI